MKLGIKFIFFISIFITISHSLSAQKQINQYDPEATFERGVLLYENKHYSSALECFQQYILLADDKNNQEITIAKYYEATSALFLDNSKGETKIISFVKENPTSILAHHANFLYANTLFKNKKYRNALKRYNNIEIKNLKAEEQYEYLFNKAFCLYQTQEIDKAYPLFESLSMKQNPYQEDATYYYGHISYNSGDIENAKNSFKKLRNSKKYSNIADIYLLQINFEKGNYSDVTKEGEKVFEQAQKNRKTDLALILAESWYNEENYSKSLEYYELAKQNTRRQLPREIEFKIGFCKMKNQDYEGAISNFEKVTDKNDELGQYGSYYLAQCYTYTDQDKFARNTFLKAYKMNFNDTLSENALFNYAALSFIPGIDPFNEAVNILNEYIKNNPNSAQVSDAQDIVIHLLLNSGDYDNALSTIEQYSKISPELDKIQAQLTYNVGIQHYQEGDYSQSISFLRRTINSKNTDHNTKAEALYWMADAYYQQKDDKNALKTYSQFIKMPSANTLEIYPLAYYNMGYIYLHRGDFENAVQKFKEYLNHDKTMDKSRQSDSWARIGDCHFIQRQYNNAITAYSNATKLDNKNADYCLYQQAMGYGALGKTNEKINCLNIIISKHQKSSFFDKALYETGIAHLSSNDNRSAIVAFDRLVKERPRSSFARKAQIKVGMIYYNNDEYDKALSSLKTLVNQYPNTEESREAINIIGNIYRDKNEIQTYFDYLENNNIAKISIDEQDSLTFKTIENFYTSRKYGETIKGAKKYFEKYPDGSYLLNVHYFIMKSMEAVNNFEGIKEHINYIIQTDNDYTDNALLLIARIEYDSLNYEASAGYYERLINITENQHIMVEAIEGCMKSSYFCNKYEKAIEMANQLINLNETTDNQRYQAYYILGRSYYDIDNLTDAMHYFDLCSDNNNETAAECTYYSALCLYKSQKYNEAEEKVFYLSDNLNSYIDWTARSFILLSDIYHAQGNDFQARETLKSVIDNYPKEGKDSDNIVNEAKEKLNKLENAVIE